MKFSKRIDRYPAKPPKWYVPLVVAAFAAICITCAVAFADDPPVQSQMLVPGSPEARVIHILEKIQQAEERQARALEAISRKIR